MPHHRILDPQPSPEADIDTAEMAEASAFVDYGEENLRALSRLRQIAMEMLEAQMEYAKARLAAVASNGGALNPGEEPTAPIDKLGQTVRRTAALQMKFAADVEKRRCGLVAERARRRLQRAEDHKTAVTDEIDNALTEAFTVMYGDGDDETDEGDALCREMLADKENLLVDLDEFKDYLTRPVGDTVAKLCVALGLPADTCLRQGDIWRIKRPPSPYETFRQTRAAEPNRPSATAVSGHPP